MAENSYRYRKKQAQDNSILVFLTPPPLADITRQINNVNCKLETPEPVTPTPGVPPKKRIKCDNLQNNSQPDFYANISNNSSVSTSSSRLIKDTDLCYGLTLQNALFQREIWGTTIMGGSTMASKRWNVSTRFFIKDFKNTDNNVFRFLGDRNFVAPFVCSFSHVACNGKLLAAADEEGMVGFIDARYDNTIELERVRNEFRAHDNAVFDVMWSHDDCSMVTASGDQTAKLWDVELQQCKATFGGHTCSIKSVNFNPLNPNLWVTSSRDGNIFIWDTRLIGLCSEGDVSFKPVISIRNAHSHDDLKKKSRKSNQLLPIRSKPTSSVTGVQFLMNQDLLLASSGASDSIIKYWDLRNQDALSNSTPVQTSLSSSFAKRPHGISDLILDQSGTRLYASSTDHRVYMYDAANLGAPIGHFTSKTYRCSSFYVRLACSPDGRYIASGSSDKSIYIWEVDFPGADPVILKAHENEVTSLSWSKDIETFASCSDDTTLRIWRIDGSNNSKE
ncbi:WD40-repeat-containing domain protein [Glomus cerebriforme]|uniref:WD40-repeat-containing domain protein n=1 Tax=Glomus cerebriforme TaxID=658196 RepID=A0A397TF39_9GLOM|nr:WD40-repeat-containing domain protein [Glomus cerebriforme]